MRDFLDSLYRGYPVGYIISWKSQNVRLKNGTFSKGQKILIDGQQRVTALKASILEDEVINKKYKKVRIKIASNEIYKGHNIRKCIDYFCHCAKHPEYYEYIKLNDKEFNKTDFSQKISWLKEENDDLYDPSYSDLLHVAFISKFNRGKLEDLVSLLSGRDFERRTYFL